MKAYHISVRLCLFTGISCFNFVAILRCSLAAYINSLTAALCVSFFIPRFVPGEGLPYLYRRHLLFANSSNLFLIASFIIFRSLS